jgi:DNA excision repair protein ERCC-4
MNPIFQDIFLKKEKSKEIENKQKILIDYREKNSLVPSQLKKIGFDIEFKELKVGDYITRNIIIERKTISDFKNSMISKHLYKQIKDLQQYEDKLLIIEGYENEELYPANKKINPNAIRGFLLSIVTKYKIPTILSKNAEDTARFISLLSKKKSSEISLKAKKKNMNKKEQIQFILEGFNGIGPKNSKKLLKKFSTLQNIFSAPQEELEKVIGKKAKIFMLIEEKY